MNDNNKINEFLNLINEIAKNGIEIDSNLVYSNLINFNNKKESISHYFEAFKIYFENIKNIDFSISNSFFNIYSPNLKSLHFFDNKIYIPQKRTHIFNSVRDIFKFLAQNNIKHSSVVTSSIREDDIVISVSDFLDIEKIKKFVQSKENVKDGIVSINPFMFHDDYISVAWDGSLSYNYVVSEWISDYINELKLFGRLDCCSLFDFNNYLLRRYKTIFEKGIGINRFIESREFIDVYNDLLCYKYITEELISVLNLSNTLNDFNNKVQLFGNKEKNELEKKKLKALTLNEKIGISITPFQQEVFDYLCIELNKKIGEERTILLFKSFIQTGDYRVFSKENNIRKIMFESKITPFVMNKMMFEEMKMVLINSSLETVSKYDVVQLGRALFGIRNGIYDSFTNSNNSRKSLEIMVRPNEIDDLIKRIIEEDKEGSLSIDDCYWIFIDYINSRVDKNKNKH